MALGEALHPRISQSTGAIRYWDPSNSTGTANDANDGQTRATAWRTQTKAISSVPLGGRVIVIGDGVTVTPPAGDNLVGFRWNRAGGSNSLVTTFEAETWRGVRFSTGFAPGAPTYGYACGIEQPGIRLKGIKIGGRGYTTGTGEGSPGLWIFKYAKAFELEDCEFSDIGGMGCYMVGDDVYGGFIEDFWFYRCLFHDIGLDTHIGTTPPYTDGYYANKGTHMVYGPDNQGSSNDVAEGGRYGVFASCIFYGNMPGRHMQPGAAAQNMQYVNCTSYGNTGLPMNGAAVSAYAGSFIEYYNDSPSGVYRTNYNVVKNCIAALSKGSIVYGSGGGMDGNLVDNNLAYAMQNEGASHNGWSASEDYPNEYIHGSGSLLYVRGTPIPNSNPRFVNAASGDFRLQEGSPGIGVGIPEYTPPLDYYGNPFHPTTPSIGAVESGSGITQPPTILGEMPLSTLWPGDVSNRTLAQMPANTPYGGGTLGSTPLNTDWPPGGTATPATVRSVSQGTVVGGTTLNIPKPAGMANGDVIYAIINTRTYSLNTIPSGFTELTPTNLEVRTDTDSASWSAVKVYRKVITDAASEPANYTWIAAAATKIAGGIVCVQDADNTTPEVTTATATNNHVSQATFAAPSLNILTATGSCLICVVGQGKSTTFTPPNGMTERVDVAAGSSGTDSVTLSIATQDDVPNGPTGSKIFTDAQTSTWFIMAGWSIAVKAAA